MRENNKTRFFVCFIHDKTWGLDQSERARGPLYFINLNKKVAVQCMRVRCVTKFGNIY